MAELQVLTACLTQAGLLNAEAIAGLSLPRLSEALLRAAAPWGAVHAMIGRASRMTGLLRDRVTGEMHAVMAGGLRDLEDAGANPVPREEARRWTPPHRRCRLCAGSPWRPSPAWRRKTW